MCCLCADGPRPQDIKQGSLGTCWLLSGFASVAAAVPEMIEQCFVSPLDPATGKPTISPTGRYVVQLWDVPSGKYRNIVIDDK